MTGGSRIPIIYAVAVTGTDCLEGSGIEFWDENFLEQTFEYL